MEWKTRKCYKRNLNFDSTKKKKQLILIVVVSTLLINNIFYHASIFPIPETRNNIPETRNNIEKERTEPIIKFYLYPLEYFPSFWGKKSTCDHSKILFSKHDAYIFAIQAMKHHPWRTSDPREAMIAILPISLDVHSRGGCPGLEQDTILEELRVVVQNSTIYPMIRHVFIAQDWRTWFHNSKMPEKILSLLKPAGIVAGMEGRGDCRTSLPYTTNYASFMSMREPNSWYIPNPAPFGASRVYSINMVGKFDENPEMRDRLALFTSNGSIPNSFITTTLYSTGYSYDRITAMMALKNSGLRFCQNRNDNDRCISKDEYPSRLETQTIMEKSNYTLALRGDTYGSDRWSQAMVAGNAIIQVVEGEEAWGWLPFPCAIPWRDIVLSIPRDKYLNDPAKSLTDLISNVTEMTLLRLQQSSIYYASDIEWTTHNSRVLENFLRESYYIPCRDFEESVFGAPKSLDLHKQGWCVPRKPFSE